MKITKLEKNWILYDVGNSAFVMLLSTIIPIYFKNIASNSNISLADSTAYWGYVLAFSTLIVAFIGPFLGSIGDNKGYKKKFFIFFVLLGSIATLLLGLFNNWIIFLIIILIARVGFNASLIFYDAMLTDISDEKRMDHVSSLGYAWGYIGSCIPFLGCLLLILNANKLGLSTTLATTIAFVITALWWLCFTLPLMKNYHQKYYVASTKKNLVKTSFKRLFKSIKNIIKNKIVFTFLIAFFLYIDGVYTIIEMATSYGKDVGISDNSLLLALLLTQIIAFPMTIIVTKIIKIIANYQVIIICICGYLGVTLFALQLDKPWEFWFLAVCVALFQGSIQALSRSYFAQIIPKEVSNEYFGIYDIFGKGATFIGALIMGIAADVTGNSKNGIVGLIIIILFGLIVFIYHLKIRKRVEINE
ncbi:MAG: MFS transporter [Bacilli bacterium]|jgi:UMF1 family MFS transporter|nr:MFS transporter [Bacilli bacterium]